jgi:hypothetical protein
MQLTSLGVKQALREGGPGELPRVSVAEAMVERCHRLFLRTLKALQDQRRVNASIARERTVRVGFKARVEVTPVDALKLGYSVTEELLALELKTG